MHRRGLMVLAVICHLLWSCTLIHSSYQDIRGLNSHSLDKVQDFECPFFSHRNANLTFCRVLPFLSTLEFWSQIKHVKTFGFTSLLFVCKTIRNLFTIYHPKFLPILMDWRFPPSLSKSRSIIDWQYLDWIELEHQ